MRHIKRKGSIPLITSFPTDIFLRHDEYEASEWSVHSHAWGQFNFVSDGVMHLEIANERFLSPPQYAIWIPPFVEHFCSSSTGTVYRSVYIALKHCKTMPKVACTAKVSPVLRAILDDFASRDVRTPVTLEDQRMSAVVLDQVIASPDRHQAFLPHAASSELNKLLDMLHNNPGERRSTAELADHVHASARTIERRCQKELGMSLNEWRQRLKFVLAIERLKMGKTVQSIAADLGYATTSAFIVMFRRMAGKTPEQYRNAKLG